MRLFLIIINIILAGGIAYQGYSLLKPSGKKIEYSLGGNRNSAAKEVAKVQPKSIDLDSENAISTIIGQNIFNLDRCPDAVSGRRSTQSIQMTLVGVCKVGPLEGAIIQQRQQARRWGNQQTQSTQNTEKERQQFFKVGEELGNGYVLASIAEDSVKLKRGSSTLILELETAGRFATSSTAQPRPQPTAEERMMQMQGMMMRGQMNMARMMMRQQQQMQQQNTPNVRGAGAQSNRR